MFEWPRFSAHLGGARSSQERVASLLVDLARRAPTPSAKDVLAALFDDGDLVDEMARLAPRMHHVGFVAPHELGTAEIEEVLKESRFRNRLRKVKSVVLAKELSSRLGRPVDLTIVQGSVAEPATRCPTVEIFVPDLPTQELASMVSEETGCHVALALEKDSSLARVRDLLRAHACREIPVMRDGPLANREMGASVLYVDVPGGERTRRLEFIASA